MSIKVFFRKGREKKNRTNMSEIYKRASRVSNNIPDKLHGQKYLFK